MLNAFISAADEATFTIQETTARTGMSEHNLRYYERVGLLQPIRRDTSSGHRRYSLADLVKIQMIVCLRATGMPIKQMHHYFDLVADGKPAAPHIQSLLTGQKAILEERMRQLQQYMAYLQRKIAFWNAVEADDHQAAAAIVREMAADIMADNPDATSAGALADLVLCYDL